MLNAADEASATPTIQPGGVPPQLLIVTVDSVQAAITLIAPTEGEARFIASRPAVADEPHRGIPGALTRLAAQCGFVLTEEMIGATIVAGPPIALRVVGVCDADDATALAIAEQFGVARIIAEPMTPPRNPTRDRLWYRPITNAWRDGRIEALLVVVPPGILPLWAAQFLTALGEVTADGQARVLLLASDADLADTVAADAIFLPRDAHRASHLTGALNRLRAARLLRGNAADAPIIARTEALAVAIRAVCAAYGGPCVYLDVADGATVMIADENRVNVHHDPEIDYARGAVRLLNRCETAHISRWVPFAVSASSLRSWALRRMSAPMAMLADEKDRVIAAGFAHAALSMTLEKIALPIPDGALWVLGPALTRLVSHAAALRFVADLMPSVRVAIVTCDDDDLIPAVGALSVSHPADASSLLAHDALVPTGSVVQAASPGRRARGVMTATLASDDRTVTIEVTPDTLMAIPCLGSATFGRTDNASTDDRVSVHGGPGGLLIDTRRRPLAALTPHPSRPSVSSRLRPASATNDRSDH